MSRFVVEKAVKFQFVIQLEIWMSNTRSDIPPIFLSRKNIPYQVKKVIDFRCRKPYNKRIEAKQHQM
jgi:hypothetical protein